MKLEDRVKALEDVWAVAFQEHKLRVDGGQEEDLALRLARALGPLQDLEAQVSNLRDEVKDLKAMSELRKSELLDVVSRTEPLADAVQNFQEQTAAAHRGLEEARQKVEELCDWTVKHEQDPEAHRRAHMTETLGDGEAQLVKEALERQAEMLAKHDSEISEMRGTRPLKEATGCFSSTSPAAESEKRFQSGRPQERSDLQVYSDRAEWLIRDAFALKASFPKGEAIESPRFNLEVPGVGHLHDLCFRFFPNGAIHAQAEDSCSLYLAHPLDMPWSKYELAVGRTIQGPFDPIFGGTDDFCSLSANLSEDEVGQSAVCIGVRFLAKAADS